jgi:nitrogen regulatory protein P-II 1
MKYIIAVVRPHKLEDVKKELLKEDVHLMTITEVLGCGRQQGVTEVYRGVKEVDNLLKKVKIEVAVNDDYADKAVKAIIRGAKEGEIGDGKIFILDLKDCIRIRTGETGGAAIG